jgi:glucose/arabinose dehydrogenase
MSRLVIVSCCVFAIACKKAPAPPDTDRPAQVETINGTESIGWEQAAADAVELALIRYAIYVDGTRSELTGVSCASVATADGFSCSARLPGLTAGAHTLELAAFVDDGQVLESARSAPLSVVVTPAIVINDTPPAATVHERDWSQTAVVTNDGVRMRIEKVAGGLNEPADLAFIPDGRLLIAERGGRIRVVRDGVLVAEPALSMRDALDEDGELIAVAVDPQFDRNQHVFVIYTEPSRSGRTFVVARFREVFDTLGDRAVLLDRVPASASARASLRFGPDRKLYAAFDDGGTAALAGDPGSWNGKVLRLNADGTTPADQQGLTPVYRDGYRSPRGLDWDSRSAALWSIDGEFLRAGDHGTYALPPLTNPSSIAFYRGTLFPAFSNDLFVASDSGRHMLRLRIDPLGRARPIAVDQLLQDVVGGLRSVAIGPEGAVYFATSDAVGRVVPVRSEGGWSPR